MILYALYRVGVFMALSFPVGLSYRIASLIAVIYCSISSRDRNAVMKNLRVVLGERADEKYLARISADVFKNFAKYLVDFFRFTVIDADYIKSFVTIRGTEHIDSALRRGNGAILLSAHIGNWELGGSALCYSGYPVIAVVLTHQNKKINDFFTRQRVKGKMKPIEIGASLKSCYRTLTKNGLLALLGDRDFTKNGLSEKFFGKTTLVPKGPAVLAYRLGSAIVPTFMVRKPDDSFLLYTEEPIYADLTKDEESSVKEVAGRYLRSIENCIRKYPAQWFVFREIWECDASKPVRPDTII